MQPAIPKNINVSLMANQTVLNAVFINRTFRLSNAKVTRFKMSNTVHVGLLGGVKFIQDPIVFTL
jgi:hypothetical protein